MGRILSATALALAVGCGSAPAIGADLRASVPYHHQLCGPLARADVVVLPNGFLLRGSREFLLWAEVAPSLDRRFWRCTWNGRRFLFVPAGKIGVRE